MVSSETILIVACLIFLFLMIWFTIEGNRSILWLLRENAKLREEIRQLKDADR